MGRINSKSYFTLFHRDYAQEAFYLSFPFVRLCHYLFFHRKTIFLLFRRQPATFLSKTKRAHRALFLFLVFSVEKICQLFYFLHRFLRLHRMAGIGDKTADRIKDFLCIHLPQQHRRGVHRRGGCSLAAADQQHSSALWFLQQALMTIIARCPVHLQAAEHTQHRTGDLAEIDRRSDDNVVTLPQLGVNLIPSILDAAALVLPTVPAVAAGMDAAGVGIHHPILSLQLAGQLVDQRIGIAVFSGRSIKNQCFHLASSSLYQNRGPSPLFMPVG